MISWVDTITMAQSKQYYNRGPTGTGGTGLCKDDITWEFPNEEVDRKCTINVNVDVESCSVKDLIDALETYNSSYLGYTKCIQQLTKRRFRWSIDNPKRVDEIIKDFDSLPLFVGTNPAQTTAAKRTPMVILYDAPYELDDDSLGKLMSKFGKVASIKRGTIKGYPNILDGKIFITFEKMYMHLPDEILLGKSGRILLREPGQPVKKRKCYKCGEYGTHLAEKCTGPDEVRCHFCKEAGHYARDCIEKKNAQVKIFDEKIMTNQWKFHTPPPKNPNEATNRSVPLIEIETNTGATMNAAGAMNAVEAMVDILAAAVVNEAEAEAKAKDRENKDERKSVSTPKNSGQLAGSTPITLAPEKPKLSTPDLSNINYDFEHGQRMLPSQLSQEDVEGGQETEEEEDEMNISEPRRLVIDTDPILGDRGPFTPPSPRELDSDPIPSHQPIDPNFDAHFNKYLEKYGEGAKRKERSSSTNDSKSEGELSDKSFAEVVSKKPKAKATKTTNSPTQVYKSTMTKLCNSPTQGAQASGSPPPPIPHRTKIPPPTENSNVRPRSDKSRSHSRSGRKEDRTSREPSRRENSRHHSASSSGSRPKHYGK